MKRARLLQVFLVAVTLCSSVVVPMASIGTAQSTDSSSSDAYVSIGNISVSPENPEPGETVTITATAKNSESSGDGVEITQMSLRSGISNRDTASDLGSLGAGDSMDVPFSTTFDSEGEKKLNVVVRGTSPNGGVFVIEKPVYVNVERSSDASLAFSTVHDTDTAADAVTPINVTVANGDSEAITGIHLDLDGASVENSNRIKGSIDAGSEDTFQYDVTFDEVGTQTLTGEVTYTTAGGTTRTTAQSVDIEVVGPEVRADVSAQTTSDGNTEVVLTNFGNAQFTDVEIEATTNGEVVARNLMSDVDPDSNESIVFDVPSSVDGSITYTATYTAAGASHTTSLTDQSSISGEVGLTGVETTQTGTGLTIEGEAANLGSTDAESVLLSVKNTDGVSPAAPSGEYFAGNVEAGEFATFELTADVQSDASSIPVEATYIVEGTRVTTTQQIGVSSMDASAQSGEDRMPANGGEQGPPGAGGQSGLPLMEIGIGVAVLLLGGVGFIAYRWRQQ